MTTEDYDEYGIPVKKKPQSQPTVDEYGIPIKKKDPVLEQLLKVGSDVSLAASKKPSPGKKDKLFTPDISSYNKQFEENTGYKEFSLREPSKPTNVLETERYDTKKKQLEESKYGKYRTIEETEINPVLNKVASGTVKPEELSSLFNKPYGKQIVNQVTEGEATAGKDWDEVAKELNIKNRPAGVKAENEAINELHYEIIKDLQGLTVTRATVSGGTGGAAGSAQESTIPDIDTNNTQEIGRVISILEDENSFLSKDGKAVDKQKLIEKLQAKSFYLNVNKPLNPEIEELSPKIKEAITRFNIDRERGEKGIFGKDDESNLQHFMYGLNLIKDERPGSYANIVRGINERGKIADTDMEMVAGIGQQLYNKRLFREGAVNPEAIGKETDLDYTSYQTKRADIARRLSEHPMVKYFAKGIRKVPTQIIAQAADDLGIENKDIVQDIKYDEWNNSTGIVKSGLSASFFRGAAQPIKGIQSTVDALTQSPVDSYLNSKRFDYGDQKVADDKGNYRDVLPKERENVFNIAAEGFGEILTQVLGAKTIGKTGIKNVYGQTAPFVLAQTYGDSFKYFLDKTGDPSAAALAGTVDAVATVGFETFILPDVKIFNQASKLLTGQKRKLAQGIIDVVKKGEVKSLRNPIREFSKNVTNILVKENVEEIATNLENYINEALVSQSTVKDRNLANELGQTAKATTFATSIPALLGAGGQTKNEQQFTKDGLHQAAINFQEYKDAFDKAVLDNAVTQPQYDEAMEVLNIHKKSIDNAPKRDSKGDPISTERQLEYAYQNTVAEVNEKMAEGISDKVLREPIEKKVADAQEAKRKIFGGVEVKGLPKEEVFEPPSEDELLLSEIKSKSGELVQAEELPFFIEQAANDPAQFVERYGEETVNKLLSKATDEQLARAAVNMAKFDPEHPGIEILNEEMERREAAKPAEVPTPPPAGESIEAKKADIERRRKWGLAQIAYSTDEGKFASLTEDRYIDSSLMGDSEKEVQDKVNAKYDAELAALTEPQKQVGGESIEGGEGAGEVNTGGKEVDKYSDSRYKSEVEVGQKYYDNRYGDFYTIEKMTPFGKDDVSVTLKYDKGKTREEKGSFLLYHIDAKQHTLSKEQQSTPEVIDKKTDFKGKHGVDYDVINSELQNVIKEGIKGNFDALGLALENNGIKTSYHEQQAYADFVKIKLEEELPKKLPNKKDKFNVDKTDFNGEIDVRPIEQKIKPIENSQKGREASLGKMTSEDELRPAMTGVYHDVENKALVATDAHKLVWIDEPSLSGESKIVDPKSGKTIDARFPDYKVVIPEDNPIKIDNLSATDLINKTAGVDRANRFITEEILAVIRIGENYFAFDPKLFNQVVTTMAENGAKTINIEMSKPNRGVVFSTPENKNIHALLMPKMFGDSGEGGLPYKIIYERDSTKAERTLVVESEINSLNRDLERRKKELSTAVKDLRKAKTNNEMHSAEFDVKYAKERVADIESQIAEKKEEINSINNPLQEQQDLQTVKENIKDGNITEEEATAFTEQDNESLKSIEPIVEDIESKTESNDKAELEEVVTTADEIIKNENIKQTDTKDKQGNLPAEEGKPTETTTPEVGEGAGETKVSPEKQAFHDRVDKAAASIIKALSAKLPPGTQKQGMGIEEIVTAAANIIKKAYDLGTDIKEAIDDAVRLVRETFKKEGYGDIDEDSVRGHFEAEFGDKAPPPSQTTHRRKNNQEGREDGRQRYPNPLS